MRPDPPTLNVRRVEEHRWLFLRYEGEAFARFEERWYVETRPDREGFWLVCGFPWTFASEPALAMLDAELALVRPAMEEIRRQAARGPLDATTGDAALAPPPEATP